MAFKHFYKSILIRLLILVILTTICTFLFIEMQSHFLGAVFLILIIISIINLLRYFNKINRWIAFFLLGIENEDTTLRIPSKTGNKSIDEVFKGMDKLNTLFKQTKIDISTQEQYYRSVINQSATGLLSINGKGRVININPAAIKLTNLHDSHHVNSLATIDKALPDFIMNFDSNQKQTSAIFENKYGQKLLFKLSEIITTKESVKLVAVSDITKELDNREVDAWVKLARTLSHEIMNNITPITTLSQVISSYFLKSNKTIELEELDLKTIVNTIKGLRVIEERSLALMNFVENYRKFTKLPAPQLKIVNLSQLIENNIIASNCFYGFNTIELEKSIPENVEFSTDEKLLSQVIINLLKNACEALVSGHIENPKLIIKLLKTNIDVRLEISNNGPNIPSEIKEQIFIPFYTSKDDGSGIGLSLSKQIMLKLNGDVVLNSTKDNLTSFVVILN